MKNGNKKGFRMRQLAVMTGGLLMGAALAAPLMAATLSSPETLPVMGRAPVLAPGTVTVVDKDNDNQLGVGDELTASFAFSDLDSDADAGTEYKWFASGVDITGAKGATYTLTAADLGKTITVEAIPHTDASTTDPADGLQVAATTYTNIGGQNLPGGLPVVGGSTLKTLTITGASGAAGNPVVGDTLTASVTCHGTCNTSQLTYQWKIEDAVGSGNYVDIKNATNATYDVTNHQKRKIKVEVTAP